MPHSPLPRLYLITDRQQTQSRPLASVLHGALEGGVQFVQLREKDLETIDLCRMTEQLIPLFSSYRTLWLINDRLDLALAYEATGVHLRSTSLPPAVARNILGPTRLIGASVHSQEEAVKAESEGADFVVLGPIYDTPSKRAFGKPLGCDTLHHSCHTTRIPVFAIGGITLERVTEVREAGAYGVAVISSILQAPDVVDTTRRFLDLLS